MKRKAQHLVVLAAVPLVGLPLRMGPDRKYRVRIAHIKLPVLRKPDKKAKVATQVGGVERWLGEDKAICFFVTFNKYAQRWPHF